MALGALLAVGAVIAVLVITSTGGATTPTFDGSTVAISLREYAMVGDLRAPAGNVRFDVTNNGGLPHDVGIRGGPISGELRPGGSTTLDLGELTPGTYELICDVGDHIERGMVATLTITAPTAPTPTF